ncbi:MAG: hypothetical protein ACXWNW_14180 [Isosphaeraceae bacterium]
MEYAASIHWPLRDCPLVGVLRVHPGSDGKLGDDYEWCCTVVRSGDVAILMGAMVAPTPAMARAVKRCLAEAGMTRRQYDRLNGVPRSVVHRQ